ncbi:MAG: phosphopantothenoylcysteine decarboxylase/phosphopantothenate/cysteine ligase [Thermomicrobiales bacterium]|jgi:phosphopantothenoylcysteine decarboxylase/phosphopantothenate--cysteine ligase|nr:phosphopantothenoylcysteine decarboxylase/phosphopantothenate/cysteine ligase [Thermomicrobiales bacterium]MDF3038883.1 phosphopantothenoylcysteine decarboxylase/phosphopantothenate/cysteine ligase [Thermomicrobiales bacterium]
MNELEGKTVVLGVTGGIAAYKAATVASLLMQSGARVEVVLTEGAQRFIQPLTFSAITHSAVHTDPFATWHGDFSGHISLADRAELLIVAPATAATIARLALGLADDLIGLIALSTQAPLLLAPAMEDGMFRHPATQHHVQTLADRGATVVGPETGRLASGATGMGRMAEPADIVERAKHLLRRSSLLTGSRVVVTAGGTREPLDPVRYLGNRSSGRMGYAIAEAAIAAGADVTLITGPTSVPLPAHAHVVPVETALDMLAAVENATRDADILVMAAAVADFRPETTHPGKIKKERGQDHLDVRLVRNPDILAAIDQPGLIKIGFAAETENLLANAAAKLEAKHLAMIVANDAAATIGADHSTATFLHADGTVRPLPRLSKQMLAAEVVRAAAELRGSPRRPDS